MFGFVAANPLDMTKDQRVKYRAVYCGLCRALSQAGKNADRLAISYELTFLILLLSSVNGEDYTSSRAFCPARPVCPRRALENRFTAYAADMNIILTYYKIEDDISDGGAGAKLKKALFGRSFASCRERNPAITSVIEECLKRLSETEKRGELAPSVPSGIFGELLGSVFSYAPGTIDREGLYAFGEALGRYIYFADAAADRKKDLKKENYNPLIRMSSSHIMPCAGLLLGEASEAYAKLDFTCDRGITDNIMYSGIPMMLKSKLRMKGNENFDR